MRVIFFGNGLDYSAAFLDLLVKLDEVELVAIVSPRRPGSTTNEKIASRLPTKLSKSIHLTDNEKFVVRVSKVARNHKIPVYWPEDVNDPSLVDQLDILDPDVVVMAGFTQILSPGLVDALSPIVNVHPSLLPAHRGPHPEFWVLAMGEEESGVTLHLVDKGIDTGEILAQERFDLEPWLTGGDLHRRCTWVGCEMLEQLLSTWNGEHTPRWRQQGEGSYESKVSFKDTIVPFDQPAETVFALARAASPWLTLALYVPEQFWKGPVHHTHTGAASPTGAKGFVRLALSGAQVFDEDLGTPGTIFRSETGGLAVCCSPGLVYFRRASMAATRP